MSIVYEVVLALKTEGELGVKLGQVHAKAELANASISRVGDAVERAGDRAATAFASVRDRVFGLAEGLAKVGLAAGLAAATYGVVALNSKLEQTQISLAAVFTGQGLSKTFELGMVGARDQLNKMKEDVKILPGDLGQLANIMKTIASPAAQAGAKADDIRKLAGKGMLYGMGLQGLDEGMVARELALMLSGRVGAHNVIAMRLGLSGSQAGSFKDMTPEKRLETINKALDTQIGGSADAFGKSWMAVITTVKSNLKYNILAPLTQPLFEHIKADMTKINGYFDTHKDKIDDVVRVVGEKLAGAWDNVVEVVGRIEPIFARIFRWVEDLDADKLRSIGLKAMEISMIAQMAPSAIRAGASLAGKALASGGGGAIAGEAGGLAAALGAGTASLPVLAAATIALAGVAIASAGAVDVLSDTTSEYHDLAVTHVDSIRDSFVEMGKAADTMLVAMKPSIDMIGEMFLGMLADLASDTADYMRDTAREVKGITNTLGYIWNGFWDDVENTFKSTMMHELHRSTFNANNPMGMPPGWESARPHTFNQTNHITSSITISGAQDPSRVARMTRESILNLAKHPTKSPYVTDHTLSVR
jgi:hypothetical protein